MDSKYYLPKDIKEKLQQKIPKYLCILITGERTFINENPIWGVLTNLGGMYRKKPHVIHGNAKGADTLAADIATWLDYTVTAYPANWEQYGRAAGPKRNQQMLTEGKPDLIVAFFNDRSKSKGTNHMVTISKKTRLPCLIWEETKGWNLE